ncbi:MAG: PIN domain-containing protein [Bacteroidales bacterium]|jgi:predicted nucleic acid-binding protein|nr:PIN domain-containing protein [Bacteroidales bacterium]
MDEIIINTDFCFSSNGRLTADISNRALKKYSDGIEAAIKLEGDLPIVLDTNILLDYYGMSQAEKNKLIQLIKTYANRIYITRQVEQEYLRNRLSVIKKDFFEPLNRIAPDFIAFQRDIENKVKSYKEEKKRILSKDYPELWKQLENIEKAVLKDINDEKFLNDIQDQVGTTTKNNKNISLIDEMLSLTSTLKLTDALTIAELEFLKLVS